MQAPGTQSNVNAGKAYAIMLSGSLERVELTAGEEGTSKAQFKGVAYSGGAVPRRLWDGSALVIDVESFQLSEEGRDVFILSNHNAERIVGKARAMKRNGKIVVENGTFFDNEHGKEAALLLSQGAPYEFSIGVSGDTKFIPEGKRRKMMVLGENHSVGAETYNGRLLEVSLVHAGADPKTSVARLAADHNLTPIGDETMSGQNQPHNDDGSGTGKAAITLNGKTIEQLGADCERLTTELSTTQLAVRKQNEQCEELKAKLAASEAAFAKLQGDVRTEKLTAVFGDKLTEAERSHFLSLKDDAFAAIVSKFEAEAPSTLKRDGALFQRSELKAAKDEGRPALSVMMQGAQKSGVVTLPKKAA